MQSRGRLVCAVLVGVTIFWVLPGAARAEMQSSEREGKYELYVPVRWTSSESFDGDGASSFDINSDVGWGVGFAYNFTDNILLQADFTWQNASFNANIATDNPAGMQTLGGSLDATTLLVAAQYNIIRKQFTPFIIAGVGWTWIDTNIPTGPTQGTCWWTWYGYVCDTWQPTATEDAFAYGGRRSAR